MGVGIEGHRPTNGVVEESSTRSKQVEEDLRVGRERLDGPHARTCRWN